MEVQVKKLRERLPDLLAAAVLIICECIFFRNVLTNVSMIGNRGDGRLTMLLTEHWWHFFRGREGFSELAMFYPSKEAMGCSDMLLGYGIIHSVFRLLRFDMYSAYKWTMIAVHCAGTAAMWRLMRRTLSAGAVWSLFATIAFSFSNARELHMSHTQLNAMSMLPVLLILLIGMFRNISDRWKRILYAYGFIVCFALLTYTSWYIAFFVGFFVLILMIVSAVTLLVRRDSRKELKKKLDRGMIVDALGCLIFAEINFIPFELIYIPVMRSSSGFPYSAVVPHMPEPLDIINVTESNFLLGRWMSPLNFMDRGVSWEVTQGFSIVLLIMFFALSVTRFIRKKREISFIEPAVFITILICLILPLKFDESGTSLWKPLYSYFPLVTSVRAVARLFLWLSFPMSVYTAFAADREIGEKRGKTAVFAVIATALLALSCYNVSGFSHSWDRITEGEFLNSILEPPQDAECFYIMDSGEKRYENFMYQLDAFAIADHYGIKTINGYSGKSPEGWEDIGGVDYGGYVEGMDRWIRDNGLENVYVYDMAVNSWEPHSF